MPTPLQQPRLRERKEYMANKALYKEMLPLRRNEMGRAEQAQLEIETDKSAGNLKSGAMVYWLGEDGLKSHAYSISQFGKGDFAEVISKDPCARVTQKLIDTAHAAAMTNLNEIRERAMSYYGTLKPSVVVIDRLEWLILPDEGKFTFTNFEDGREGDASALVAQVNSNTALGLGHSDWRLPSIDELKTLIGSEQDPGNDVFWSLTPYDGMSGLRVSSGSYYAWAVGFGSGIVSHEFRGYINHVRLVRTKK